MRNIDLAGIFPAVPTPFDDEGALHLDALAENLSRLNAEPLAGVVLGGSNGEFVFQTVEERVQVVAVAREVLADGRLLIAGAALESTLGTIELARRMAQAGADALLVVNPSYFTSQMTPTALERHYLAVAEAAPVPVILYSVPVNTGIDLPVEVVLRLAEHPNIAGIKDSGGSVIKMGWMAHAAPQGFQVLAGSGGLLLGALAMGAVGAISALANITASRLEEIRLRCQQGDVEGARAIQLPLIELNHAVTSGYGVAGLKAALDMLGFYGGPVRAPLLPPSERQREHLRELLMEAGLL